MKSTKIESKVKKLLKVPEKTCANCGSILVKTHSRRNLKDLRQSYYIDSEIGRCTNESCPCNGLRIYPEEYRFLIYPKSDYSLSVYATIGHQRLNESKSVSQIEAYMAREYPNLGLKSRSIEKIYKRVQVCLGQHQSDKEHIRTKLLEKGIKHLCLTLDGIAPEQGNSILYVVREVQSQVILYARYLEHSDIEHLKLDLFEPLKAFLQTIGIPIGGWLCDKQNGFIPALEEVFDGVPIHLCQAHFLKAMSKCIY